MTNEVVKKALGWLCLLVAPTELFHPAGFTHHPGMFQYLSQPQPYDPQFKALGYFGPQWWFTLHMIQTPMMGLVAVGPCSGSGWARGNGGSPHDSPARTPSINSTRLLPASVGAVHLIHPGPWAARGSSSIPASASTSQTGSDTWWTATVTGGYANAIARVMATSPAGTSAYSKVAMVQTP